VGDSAGDRRVYPATIAGKPSNVVSHSRLAGIRDADQGTQVSPNLGQGNGGQGNGKADESTAKGSDRVRRCSETGERIGSLSEVSGRFLGAMLWRRRGVEAEDSPAPQFPCQSGPMPIEIRDEVDRIFANATHRLWLCA